LALAACSVCAAALVNGDFETGDLTGWTHDGDITVETFGDPWSDPYDGLYMAKIGVDIDPGRLWTANYIKQTLDTNAPLVFQYNVFSWDVAPYDDPAFCVTVNGDEVMRISAPVDNPGPEPFTTGWQECVLDLSGYTAPLEVVFYCGNTGEFGALDDTYCQSWAYVDGVCVSDMPAGTLTMYDATARRLETTQLCAKLADDAGMPIQGETIEYTVGTPPHEVTGTAVTDVIGVARLTFPVPVDYPLGPNTIRGRWAGNADFLPAAGQAVLTVLPATPTSVTLTLDPDSVVAGETVTVTLTDNYGVDRTAEARFAIASRAGGTWAGNVYTSANAGTWKVVGRFAGLQDAAYLNVVPDTSSPPTSVTIFPASAIIAMPASQTYSVVAVDPFGNPWTPTPVQADWTTTGLLGDFDDANTFTPTDACDGTLHVTVNTVDSNEAELCVRGSTPTGAGNVIAWDRDTCKFYLCADPSNPEAGLELQVGTFTYSPLGQDITVEVAAVTTTATARVVNTPVQNLLRVRWYFRGGRLYRVYHFSTLGTTTRCTEATGNQSRVDGGTLKNGFWGIAHEPKVYVAGAPPTWSRVVRGSCRQP